MTLFGYAQKQREEYFLLKLLGASQQHLVAQTQNLVPGRQVDIARMGMDGDVHGGTSALEERGEAAGLPGAFRVLDGDNTVVLQSLVTLGWEVRVALDDEKPTTMIVMFGSSSGLYID